MILLITLPVWTIVLWPLLDRNRTKHARIAARDPHPNARAVTGAIFALLALLALGLVIEGLLDQPGQTLIVTAAAALSVSMVIEVKRKCCPAVPAAKRRASGCVRRSYY